LKLLIINLERLSKLPGTSISLANKMKLIVIEKHISIPIAIATAEKDMPKSLSYGRQN
jgi:hypothetical protein